MNNNENPIAAKQLSRAGLALLTLTVSAAVVFWLVAATPYLRLQPAGFGRYPQIYWERRYGLWLHISGGTLALFLGPLQFWLGQTRRKPAWHRALGKLYLCAIALLCAGAYYLVCTTPVGWIYAAGLGGMAVAATLTTALAVLAIRFRNFAQHREWMIRSYVVTFSFVFFRLLAGGLAAFGIGGDGIPGDIARATLAAWCSWAVPLLVTELLLQWPKLAQGGVSVARP